MHAPDLVNRPEVGEVNGLADGRAYHAAFNPVALVPWTEPGLRITRLRLLSDPGLSWWDVSYCHGSLNGEDVRVELPFSQLRKSGISRQIVEYAIRDGVHARNIGALSAVSTLC